MTRRPRRWRRGWGKEGGDDGDGEMEGGGEAGGGGRAGTGGSLESSPHSSP